MSPKVLGLQMVVFFRWQNVKRCAGLVKSISFFSPLSMFFVYLPIFSSSVILDSYFCIAIAFPVMQRE